jgi:hypothetical protein
VTEIHEELIGCSDRTVGLFGNAGSAGIAEPESDFQARVRGAGDNGESEGADSMST